MIIFINPKAKALIFDLDGTLADTMPAHMAAWVKTSKFFGAPMTEEMVKAWAGMASYKMVAKLNDRFGLSLDPKEVSEVKSKFFFEFQGASIKPIEPIYKIAEKYKDQLLMGVGTGSRRPNAERILDEMGIRNWFGSLVSADDVEHHKPAPDTFLKCAKELGVSPTECQVFEDADFGIQAATSAGMMVTDVRNYVQKPFSRFAHI